MRVGATFSVSQFIQGNLDTDTQKKRLYEDSAEIRAMHLQVKERMPRIDRSYQKLGRGKEGSPLPSSERKWSCQHLGYGFLSPRTERINFFCVKPPSLWFFVTAALGANIVYLDSHSSVATQ